MKILIVCNPDEASATELSLYLKCEAERMNRRVVVLNAIEISRTPQKFDATIIVGEIQNKRFSEPVQQYVFANLQHLNESPSFFLTVQGCVDENNLKVADTTKGFVREFLSDAAWRPQQVLVVPVGVRLQGNEFVTLTDWPELKISLQRFLVRNDMMMAS